MCVKVFLHTRANMRVSIESCLLCFISWNGGVLKVWTRFFSFLSSVKQIDLQVVIRLIVLFLLPERSLDVFLTAIASRFS